jgi:Zn-dependent peptidase ImmA (M78 family)
MRASDFLAENTKNDLIKSFLPVAQQELQITNLPTIKIVDRVPDADGTTFGCYNKEINTIYLVTQGRHPKDALRTLAHELVHYKQDIEDRLDDHSGSTGSREENEANARAGVIMRNYNQKNPE